MSKDSFDKINIQIVSSWEKETSQDVAVPYFTIIVTLNTPCLSIAENGPCALILFAVLGLEELGCSSLWTT